MNDQKSDTKLAGVRVLGLADALEAHGYPVTPGYREILDAAEAQISAAAGVPAEVLGDGRNLAEARARVLASHKAWMGVPREGMTEHAGAVPFETPGGSRWLSADGISGRGITPPLLIDDIPASQRRRIDEVRAPGAALTKYRADRKRRKKRANKSKRGSR